MTRMTLAQTLTALAEGAAPRHDHLTVEEAEISLPMLVLVERGPDGPVFIAHPPYSAYRAGIEPVTHRARLTFAELPDPARPDPAHPGPVRPVPPGTVPATPPAPDDTDRRR
ncbi:MAG: hypothetical protein ACT4OK_04745 [Gemmobacter sp.]